MSDVTTKQMLRVYEQMAAPLMFLSGFFTSPPENFHTTEEIELDIIRSEEELSIVIQDLSVGHRMNSSDIYTNKNFKPPIHKEAIPLNAHDLIKRMPGQNPFQSPDFRSNVIVRMFQGMQKIERKIRRSIEFQASQVLQTGVVTLTDSAGVPLYTIDYKPKSTHFPTVGTAWSNPASDKLADIRSLADVIRSDGLSDPKELIMGQTAFEQFISDAAVLARFDNRRMDLGGIVSMEMRGNGGTFRGIVEIGNYRYDIWTYGARFTDPQTGNSTPFLDEDKVIVRAIGRMDATFGAIPNIGQLLGVDNSALIPELPSRITLPQGSVDLHTNVWLSPDGSQLFGGVGTRPLMIPTAIDTYGCLDTNP